MPVGPEQQTQRGEILTAISDGLVALLKEYYGRGPTRAKTYYEDDLVVCLLRGGFTRVEKTLLDGGRGHAVIEQRMAFQEVMRNRFEDVIQRATGRSVIGFMRCSYSLRATSSRATSWSRATIRPPTRLGRDEVVRAGNSSASPSLGLSMTTTRSSTIELDAGSAASGPPGP
jgi:uncharacterized protein YbcI